MRTHMRYRTCAKHFTITPISGKSGSGSGRRGLIFEIRICLNTDPIPQYINCASQGTCTSPNANMTCNLVKSAILSPKIVNEKIK
ncbi:hypothetical protein DEO72_LG5g1053 [Vigna unguiculata]|uniref:Uncharacterized protein n=1 Tax=Vigna unguiculata TaxID=3917 RepID=A0A4D6LWX6_VIGUN|nr:hypothetical protein DEO72_LG5g1053 [Vigna unguiculata]